MPKLVAIACDDYELLAIAGPIVQNPFVRNLMEKHLISCDYHSSQQFHQLAVDTPVTPEMEAEALKLIASLQE